MADGARTGDVHTDKMGGFLSRWARRKAQSRGGGVAPLPEPPAAEAVTAPVTPHNASADAPPAEPLPTMADVAQLTRESDYARFVATGVDEGVKRAAMKKLFTDPHFNLMDGLDTYIDDYGKPDPIPLAMLRQMNQSKFLRLFDDDEDDEKRSAQRLTTTTATVATTTTKPTKPPDDDPDLQLQPDDAAGQPGPDQGAGA